MATKQVSGEALASNLAGMSKTQLYDIMSQMKTLIEQNPEQARQILIQNPPLTRALFQAQIMLGMVKPSQTPQASQQTQSVQPTSTHGSQLLPGQGGTHEQTNLPQAQNPVRRQQQQNQPQGPMSSTPIPGLHAQPMASQSVQQHRSHISSQAPQGPDVPSLPHLQPPLPSVSSQLQQPLQSSGGSHLPLQPPLTQSRPSSVPSSHQYQPAMGPNMNFQHHGAQQMHHLQPPFNSNMKPPSGSAMGPPFSHAQPPFSNQHLPSQYQGGSPHLGADFNNRGGPMKSERGGTQWPMGPPENMAGSQLSGPPLSLTPNQMGMGNQPARPAHIPPEMEQVLLQQVMSLTPEHMNLLPPEQRNQVLQLQQMLRHSN